jgi:hypothetical protein
MKKKKDEEIKKIEVSIVELATLLTAGLITSLFITTHKSVNAVDVCRQAWRGYCISSVTAIILHFEVNVFI